MQKIELVTCYYQDVYIAQTSPLNSRNLGKALKKPSPR